MSAVQRFVHYAEPAEFPTLDANDPNPFAIVSFGTLDGRDDIVAIGHPTRPAFVSIEHAEAIIEALSECISVIKMGSTPTVEELVGEKETARR